MNYVTHCLLAEGCSPEFRFGAIAPDLVGMSRTRLNRIKVDDPGRLSLSAGQLAVQKGIDYHIAVDVVFSQNPTFSGLKKLFRDEIAPQHLPRDLRQTGMIADIGSELLLDGLVMRKWPESVGLYHETVAWVEDENVAIASNNPEEFIKTTRRFKGRLPDYSHPGIVALNLYNRVVDNERLTLLEGILDALGVALAAHQPNVNSVGEELFAQTREAVEYLVQDELKMADIY